eukprot:1754189-Prymnesium_polylepis.1
MPFVVRGRVVHHRGMGILVARARHGPWSREPELSLVSHAHTAGLAGSTTVSYTHLRAHETLMNL